MKYSLLTWVSIAFISSVALSCAKRNVAQTTPPASVESPSSLAEQSGYSARVLEFRREKRAQGVTFMASGEEPFWGVELRQNEVWFRRLAEKDTLIKLSSPTITEESNDQGSYTRIAAAELEVLIRKDSCASTMSDETFPYRVEVRWQNETYRGCGYYLYDDRIQDIWVLERLHDEAMGLSDFPDGLPYLEIHPVDGRISGFGGCNRYHGTANVRASQVEFGPVAATKKYCGNTNRETSYFQALQGTYEYQLDQGKLVFSQQGRAIMVFRKAD